MSPSAWRDRPVFITGVTGFVGSALAARLVGAGARVVGLVREEDLPHSTLACLGIDRRITMVRGSLEDGPLLARAVAEHAIEVVYHLGAQAIVGVATESPRATFTANIAGTWNVLEACRGHAPLRAVIVASSDKAYGTHPTLPYREEFPLQPHYPYDVSKACAELIARSYWFTYQLPVVITRFANLYGPGDLNFSRIVPDAIRHVLQGTPPVIRSDGTPERDYLYIDDAIDLYLLLAERIQEIRGEAFNAGPNAPLSVRALVELILRLAGRTDLTPQVLGRGTPHGEIDRQCLDGRKARERLGWTPRISLEDGVQRALAWYADYLHHAAPTGR